MLIVLEIAPERNGWAAAIMRTWAMGAMKRLPPRPHLLAQSNTGRCSARRCGAPSRVIVPHTWSLARRMSSSEKPSAESMSKVGSESWSSEKPSTSRQKSSPRLQRLKAKPISNACGSSLSILATSASVKPISLSLAWVMRGLPTRLPAPRQ